MEGCFNLDMYGDCKKIVLECLIIRWFAFFLVLIPILGCAIVILPPARETEPLRDVYCERRMFFAFADREYLIGAMLILEGLPRGSEKHVEFEIQILSEKKERIYTRRVNLSEARTFEEITCPDYSNNLYPRKKTENPEIQETSWYCGKNLNRLFGEEFCENGDFRSFVIYVPREFQSSKNSICIYGLSGENALCKAFWTLTKWKSPIF